MDFILLLGTVLLLGVAVWLWRLSKVEVIGLSLQTSLAPIQNVTASPVPRPSAARYRPAVDRLSMIPALVVLFGLALGIVGSIYLLIEGYIWAALILMLLLLPSLFLRIRAQTFKPATWTPELSPTERATPPPPPPEPWPAPEPQPTSKVGPTLVMGEPAPVTAWLVQKSGGSAGRLFSLTQARNTIGRDGARCDIVLDDDTVSSEHAAVLYEKGQFVLYDLASTSGTFLNNRRIQRQSLLDDDVVRLGEVALVFKAVVMEKGDTAIGNAEETVLPGKGSPEDSHFDLSRPQEREPEVQIRTIEYAGETTLPGRVYVGDSHTISIVLRPTFHIPPTDHEALRIQDTRSGKSIVVHIPHENSVEQFLEIELLAAGLEIAGEKKQRQPLTSPTLSYLWNCYFPNSGRHWLSLVLRLVGPSDTIELGVVHHNINVAKLDGLTQRQVWLMASLAGILSGGLAIAEALRQLGVW